MSTPAATPATEGPATTDKDPKRWLLLGVVATAQLMVVLDATVVNIALPDAQKGLGFSNNDRQWVVTAYALAFGSLLLLGGRIGDLFGRKRAFITGGVGFAVASAVGGASTSFGMLVTARAAQGLFGALLAPAALSVLTVTFSDPSERNKAFGIFGAVAAGGSAVGLVLGGFLTEFLSWRWCLYVNLIFAVVAVTGAVLYIHDRERPEGTLDVPGTLLATGGLFGVVFGFAHAATGGWGSTTTVVALAAGAALLVGFVLVQQRVSNPLLPLRVILDRTRGGSYLAVGISGIAIFGVFLFLTFYLQDPRTVHYSPLVNGVAFVPLTVAIVLFSTTSNIVLLSRVGPKILVFTGMMIGGLGMLLLVRLPEHAVYVRDVLPTLLLLGMGFGLIFAPAINSATQGVEADDAGVASAMVNTMQQVSGSIGTALLSTIVATTAASYLRAHGGAGATAAAALSSTLHSYHVIFVISACVFFGGAILCGLLIRRKADQAAIAERSTDRVLVGAH